MLYYEKFKWKSEQTDMGVQILDRFFPNRTSNKMDIDLALMIEWIKVAPAEYFHMLFTDFCNPCVVNYDYVVKTETHGADGAFVIREKLQGRGAPMDVQTQFVSKWYLKEYGQLLPYLVEFLLRRHAVEFENVRLQLRCPTEHCVLWICGGEMLLI